MKPHQQRVVDEKTELDSKLTKLGEFIEGSAIFKLLDEAEQARLVRQRGLMSQYSDVLGERITAFPTE